VKNNVSIAGIAAGDVVETLRKMREGIRKL
jgi:hypothetical protein